MPVEAGAKVGEDTTEPVPPSEKNTPVINGNNVETLPIGIGKQVFILLVSVTGIFFYRGGRAFLSRWSMHLFGYLINVICSLRFLEVTLSVSKPIVFIQNYAI